jgi:hypothetical protein
MNNQATKEEPTPTKNGCRAEVLASAAKQLADIIYEA